MSADTCGGHTRFFAESRREFDTYADDRVSSNPRVGRDGRKTLAWRARSSRAGEWKLAGQLTSIAYIAWSLWLIALGVTSSA